MLTVVLSGITLPTKYIRFSRDAGKSPPIREAVGGDMTTKQKEQIPNTRTWLQREISGVEKLLRDLKNRRVFRASPTWSKGMRKHYTERLSMLRERLKTL